MGELVGRKIVGQYPLSKKFMAEQDWAGDDPPVALKLDDGTILYPSADPEGNGPGMIFGKEKNGTIFGLVVRK